MLTNATRFMDREKYYVMGAAAAYGACLRCVADSSARSLVGVALVALKRGDDIRFENLRLKLDRSGIKASDENGTISAVNKPFGSPGRSFITIQRFDRNRKNLHGAANPLALYRGTRGERCDEQCGTGTEHGTRQFSDLHGRGEIPRLGPEESGTDPPDGVG